ncbi:MAG: SLC13 family permease [Nitrospiraceae bacterium]
MPLPTPDTPTPEEDPVRRSASGHLLALAAGPAVAVLLYLLPMPALTADAHALTAILGCVILYWILEPIPLPVTSLLGSAACVIAGLGSAKSVFASFGHPIIFLFIGSFLLAEAMAVHGVDRRVATAILSLAWVGARPSRILLALGAATAVISMWISNTAATALMLPIGLGVLATLRDASAESMGSYRIGLMLMLSYAATVGGMATIIGTPPNLIGAGLIAQQAGVTISFFTWMVVGFPLAIVMLASAWALLFRLHPSHMPVLAGIHESVRNQAVRLGPWTRGQMNACLAFGVAVFLWVAPGLFAAIAGSENPAVLWIETHLPNELVALLAAGLLFVLPVDLRGNTFTLSWKEATRINWGIILLFGGGLAFGDLMIKTGLSHAVGEGFVTFFGVTTVWGLTAIAIVAGVVVSELASNTASASLLVPVVIAIAQAADVSAVPPALGACLGASLGFALPVSTPPNAIVYGTGLVPMKSMIRTGVLFDLIGAILIWIGLWILCPLAGLM